MVPPSRDAAAFKFDEPNLNKSKQKKLGMSTNSTESIQPQIVVAAEQSTTRTAPPDPTEIEQLKQVIKSWKELRAERDKLKEQISEKNKKLKVLDEMILRTMKKNNIGALDLNSTGGRLLYRRSTAKTGLSGKTLLTLLTDHLKSDQKAADAVKFITDNREARVRESLLYEKD